MTKFEPFERYTSQYEEWFEKNKFAYQSELRAIEGQIPANGTGIEIGIGSGRFAAPLGIQIGVEPSRKMLEISKQREVKVINGLAEALPLNKAHFDFALTVTTICFSDDVHRAFKETFRILKPSGFLIIGFIDKNSPIGELFQAHKSENVFYRVATFYSVKENIFHLKQVGFKNFNFTQTIFRNLTEIKDVELV